MFPIFMSDGSCGLKCYYLSADMSSSVHFDNESKNILVLGEGPTPGLDDTSLSTETKYPIGFTP